MGIPWELKAGAVQGGERVWIFGHVSDCGLWKLGDLLKWWRDSTLATQMPDNVFNVPKAVMANLIALKRLFKEGGSIRCVTKGKVKILINTQEQLVSADVRGRVTDNMDLVAVYAACGFHITQLPSMGNRLMFGISSISETRGYKYTDCKAWWIDRRFIGKNPQHPFSYAKACVTTYRSAVDAVLNDRPLVRWSPKGSNGFAYIHPDCSTETEEKVHGWLKS